MSQPVQGNSKVTTVVSFPYETEGCNSFSAQRLARNSCCNAFTYCLFVLSLGKFNPLPQACLCSSHNRC